MSHLVNRIAKFYGPRAVEPVLLVMTPDRIPFTCRMCGADHLLEAVVPGQLLPCGCLVPGPVHDGGPDMIDGAPSNGHTGYAQFEDWDALWE